MLPQPGVHGEVLTKKKIVLDEVLVVEDVLEMGVVNKEVVNAVCGDNGRLRAGLRLPPPHEGEEKRNMLKVIAAKV